MSDFLYRELEHQLVEHIEQGRWQAGERLPSIRTLVSQYGMSKTTVMHALSRLESRGLIEARPKAGFFLCDRPASPELPARMPAHPQPGTPSPVPVSVSAVTQEIMCRSAAFDILPGDDPRESLSPGLVQLNRHLGRALRAQRGAHRYYDEPAGSGELRELIARRYRRLGAQVDAADVTITTGCQQALYYALSTQCEPGDLVAVESPAFYGILQLLEALQLKVLEIPADAQRGMHVDQLEAALQHWPVKVCIVTPNFATPGGALMPAAARQHLLKLAQQHDFQIVEDDIYRELSFGAVQSPLLAEDTDGRVICCGSVSKTLSRDLRLGWLVSRRHSDAVQRLKLVTSLACGRYVQDGMTGYIAEGDYDRHLRRYIPELQAQRDSLLEQLQRWPQAPLSTRPNGGLAVWVQLEAADSMRLYAAARQEHILITPGALFTAGDGFNQCLRLSFAHPWTDQRRKAVQRLGELIDTDQQGT